MDIRIVWDEIALHQLASAIEYIEDDSPLNAEKVKRAILLKIDSISKHPNICPIEKYKLNNDGTYRAFEIHRYRVSYRLINDEVRIL